MRKRKRGYLFCAMIAGLLMLMLSSTVFGAESESEYNGGPIRIIYDYAGHYALNYTGNTNNYDYWNSSGTSKIVSRNYKDRTDIATSNNSYAVVSQTDSQSKIVRAYLVWETREDTGATEDIQMYTPVGAKANVTAQWVCKDTRTNNAGKEYAGVYTMATDVTDIVCSRYGGYGTYTVANIPVWDGATDGIACGGESVASWQLIVVEESPNFPLRTISLNLMSQYFYNVDYTVTVDFADASSPNGVITAQFLNGTVDTDSAYMYDGIGYEDDYNYEYDGRYYRYFTQTRGLYKNGVRFNDRDTGQAGWHGSSAVGGIRIHLFDDYRRGNSAGSQSTIYYWAGKNMGVNVFLYGVSIDIYAYDVKFDGNGADTGSMDDFTCIYGRDYNLPENGFSRQDYEFAGWNTRPDGSGTSYPDKGYIYNLTATEESVTLYAQWKPIIYRITLDNQYASINPGTQNYYEWYGVGNYTTSACTETISQITVPQKNSNFFGGYYTEKNGGGTQYIDASGKILASAAAFTKDTTLYAKWTPAVYKITLDNQGADTAGTTAYYQKYDTGNYTTSACTTAISKITVPAKNHYTFGGYYTGKNGEGQRIIDKNGNIVKVYTFDADTTLYAYWEPVTYTITLDNQGATNTGTDVFYERYGLYNYVSLNQSNVSLGTTTTRFNYTGSVQAFVAPYTGTYSLYTVGGGGSVSNRLGFGSYGGMACGDIQLQAGDILYLYVGGKGSGDIGGWNGGGNGAILYTSGSDYLGVGGGGGATDIRYMGTSLSDRILVASGGSGRVYNAINDSAGESGGSERALAGNGDSLDSSMSTAVEFMIDDWTLFKSTSRQNLGAYAGFCIEASSSGSSIYYPKRYTMLEVNKSSLGNGSYGGGGGYYGGGNLVWLMERRNGSTEIALSGYGAVGYKSDLILNGYVCSIYGVNDNSYFIWHNFENGHDYALVDADKNEVYAPYGMGEDGYAEITYTNYQAITEIANSIAIPKRSGYVFGGYYTGVNGTGTCYVDASGNILSTPTTFASDTTLYAKWTASSSNAYQIQFNGNGADGGKMSIMTCAFNTNYTLNANAFTKTGYAFTGWSATPDGSVSYADRAIVNNLSTTKGDVVVLYAQWSPADVVYKVNHYTENIGGGYAYYGGSTEQGTADSAVDISRFIGTITGFTYSHAEVKGLTATSAAIAPDGSLVINMYYTRNTYTVNLNKAAGIASVEGAGTYKYQENVTIAASVCEGYSWYAWSGTYDSADRVYKFEMPAQNVTMTASTSPLVFKITLDNQRPTEFGTMEYYEMYGIGNYAESTCQTKLDAVVIPKKAGYEFNGYYSQKDGRGTQYISADGTITAASTEFIADTTLYAYWTPITYIIRFEGNGSTGGSMDDFVCTYGAYFQLPLNQFVKTHYAFNCWNTEADGSGTNYINGSFIENLTDVQNGVITLYAVWTPNKYTVHFDANGGEGAMEDVVFTYDQTENLPFNQYTRNNGYGDSTFLGWNIIPDTREILYPDGAEVVNMTDVDGSTLTLYAIWDDCPWITAEDVYYTLDEARNGLITYDELMNWAAAEDREDGSNIMPGVDAEKGTSFTIIDYLPEDFTRFQQEGSVTETYQVIDSAGHEYKKMITVYIVDSAPVYTQPEGTTRFISEKYYNETYENGGLEENSIWKTNPDYVQAIQEAFENSRNDTPVQSFHFTHEEILQMKEFIRENGIGNSQNQDALQRFYDEFMVPNTVN